MSDMQEFCGRIEQAAANREDVTLWGVDYVALPVDADGVPIHVGDTVWDVEDGMEFVVKSVTLYAGGVTKVDAVCDGCHAHVSPDSFSHTRPDSFERIADELERYANDSYSEDEIDGMTASTLVDFAERIRKLAKKEGER